jgi:hypothetical protein
MCSLFVKAGLSYGERKPGQALSRRYGRRSFFAGMVDAHVRFILLLAVPFRKETPWPYNFDDHSDPVYAPEQADATTSQSV